MKQRHMVLLLILLFLQRLFPQINPDIFPKMGYADIYWTQANNYWGGVNHSARHFYYPELNALGLNYVVTNGDVLDLYNPEWLGGIKILDDDLKMVDQDLIRVGRSTGNNFRFYEYEAGGTGTADIAERDDKYGFGNTLKHSYWLRNRENTTGLIDEPDNDGVSIRTFCAKVVEHDSGYILRGEFPPLHQASVRLMEDYKLGIRCRINSLPSGSPDDVVAKVFVK